LRGLAKEEGIGASLITSGYYFTAWASDSIWSGTGILREATQIRGGSDRALFPPSSAALPVLYECGDALECTESLWRQKPRIVRGSRRLGSPGRHWIVVAPRSMQL